MIDLKATITGMTSPDYKERFISEYQQVYIRYTKLKHFCDKIELAEVYGVGEAPKHDCPLSLLRKQQSYMGMYLGALEMRAMLENIDLSKVRKETLYP